MIRGKKRPNLRQHLQACTRATQMYAPLREDVDDLVCTTELLVLLFLPCLCPALRPALRPALVQAGPGRGRARGGRSASLLLLGPRRQRDQGGREGGGRGR